MFFLCCFKTKPSSEDEKLVLDFTPNVIVSTGDIRLDRENIYLCDKQHRLRSALERINPERRVIPLLGELRKLPEMKNVKEYIRFISAVYIGGSKTNPPVFLLIKVQERSVSERDAQAAALACKRYLERAGYGNIDVVIASGPPCKNVQ